MTGSHIDTVPRGGPLDGALGVLAGLECLRTLAAAPVRLGRALEVAAFTDEEGRFYGFFGSRALTGSLDWSSPVDALARLAVGPVGPDGELLWDAFLHDLGYASSGTGFLIVLLYAWGGYDRYSRPHAPRADRPGLIRRQRPRSPGSDPQPSRPPRAFGPRLTVPGDRSRGPSSDAGCLRHPVGEADTSGRDQEASRR